MRIPGLARPLDLSALDDQQLQHLGLELRRWRQVGRLGGLHPFDALAQLALGDRLRVDQGHDAVELAHWRCGGRRRRAGGSGCGLRGGNGGGLQRWGGLGRPLQLGVGG